MKFTQTTKFVLGFFLCFVLLGGSAIMVMSSPFLLQPRTTAEYNTNGMTFNHVEFDKRFVLLDFQFSSRQDTYTNVVTVINFDDGKQYMLGDFSVDERIVVALNEPQGIVGDIESVNIYVYDINEIVPMESLVVSLNVLDLEVLSR